jgi:hypothetical protein
MRDSPRRIAVVVAALAGGSRMESARNGKSVRPRRARPSRRNAARSHVMPLSLKAPNRRHREIRGMSGRFRLENWIPAACHKRGWTSSFYSDYRVWTGRSRIVAVGGWCIGMGIPGDCRGSRCVRCLARLGIDGQRLLDLGSCLASSFLYRRGTQTRKQAAPRGLTWHPHGRPSQRTVR